MTSIDDIWDEPLAPASPPRQGSTAGGGDDNEPSYPSAKRPRSTLFFDSDSENDPAGSASKLPPEIDDLFKNLDVPEEVVHDLIPALDLDALRREASAKHALLNPTPYEILPSSSPHKEGNDGDKGKDGEKDEIKKRKTAPRLDEGRLLSPNGIPTLLKEAKKFKVKGKGHEASDLNRLLTVYQYWAHQLHPRTQFNDTIDRVEKLCHSRRMHVALSVWYDESKGLTHGKQPEEIIDINPDSDEDMDKLPTQGDRSDPPTRPPSSASERSANSDGDFDIDAMIREDETRQQRAHASSSTDFVQPTKPTSNIDESDNEFDVAMWEDFAFADDPLPVPTLPPPNPPPKPPADEDQDEEMWDLVKELETDSVASVAGEKTMGTDRPPPVPTSSPPDVDEWDDMYA